MFPVGFPGLTDRPASSSVSFGFSFGGGIEGSCPIASWLFWSGVAGPWIFGGSAICGFGLFCAVCAGGGGANWRAGAGCLGAGAGAGAFTIGRGAIASTDNSLLTGPLLGAFCVMSRGV